MIDIHTHILPYVDDGSPDLETSIALIKSEIEQGVTDIFVTPHYMKYRNFLSTYDNNKAIFNKLKEKVKAEKLDVNLYLGNEIYYNSKTLENLKNEIVIPLDNSKFVLIEFSLSHETEDIPEAIHNLVAIGYIPIIAHPERYPYITDIRDYKIMRKMGAKIQINAGAVNGNYGKKIKKIVLNLIKNDLVDFVASDVHDFRASGMLNAYDVVKKAVSEEKADQIFNNKMILNQKNIEISQYQHI
ncbi:CpsB/CapC family capsule biosynthesis tyrosine phosphatase [Mycoplasmatota bacterium WC30]